LNFIFLLITDLLLLNSSVTSLAKLIKFKIALEEQYLKINLRIT